jgi:hypothetical protein
VVDTVGMDVIVSTDNNTSPYKTFLTNKDVLVTDTDEYILIKILKQHKAFAKKQPTWESLVGVLKDVPAFKGKTSVEVQDLIQDAWATLGCLNRLLSVDRFLDSRCQSRRCSTWWHRIFKQSASNRVPHVRPQTFLVTI